MKSREVTAMLDLEVVPEHGLAADQWDLVLGMHFSQAISLFQSLVRIVKSAHVVYNENSPLNNDLVLDMPQDGFRLMFDARSQRLRLIEVYNLKLLKLKYCGTYFNSADVNPTVEQIDHCFGATRPGSYDKQRHVFALNFRGLTFYFPVDLQYQPHYSHGLGSIQFPGDASPILQKILIYNGTSPSDPPVPQLPISHFKGHIYCDSCNVLRNPCGTKTNGLHLSLYTNSNNVMEPTQIQFEREILFGETAQSIVSKLGSPARVYYKSDDKMKIHSREAHKKVTNLNSDYFFNYFTLGLDILIDAQSHEAIKFILHTNFPGHYDFNSYHRCCFSIRIGRNSPPPTPEVDLLSVHVPTPAPILPVKVPSPPVNHKPNGGGNGKKSPKVKKNKGNNNNNLSVQSQQPSSDSNIDPVAPASGSNSSSSSASAAVTPTGINLNNRTILKDHIVTVNYDTRWEEVNDFIGTDYNKPVVLTRSSANNPFGSSLCYGVQDIIFEVMSNDHIASVTLYKSGE